MISILSTDWGLAWGMAGISVGVVFTILLLLVCVLYIFSAVAKGSAAKVEAAAKPKLHPGRVLYRFFGSAENQWGQSWPKVSTRPMALN